jgi:predicted Zn-dependent protease
MSAADQPLGRDGCERLADAAFAAVTDGSDVEVLIQRDTEGLTRFANSSIHQNVWRDDIGINVRVVGPGGRTGVVNVHTDDPAEVARAATSAAAVSRVAPEDPEYPGLAGPDAAGTVPVDAATVAATPGQRAAAVRELLDEVPDAFLAAGAYRTVGSEIGLFTTAGQHAYAPTSFAGLSVVVSGASSSGWSEAGGRSMADIDPAASGRRAVAKARAGSDPADVPAGEWPVILEAPAVATVMQFLAYLGFGGRSWLEGRAFTSERLGEPIVDARLTLVDDAVSPAATGLPFDYEGTPKQRVELIKDGVAAAVVHDRHSAKRAGVVSTGHGLPAPNTHGPLAMDPMLLPGHDGTVDDLVSRCERGLLVTRFHYTNIVHPKETSITGMTRDGTFLVEDGRITTGVRNLRFTQSILGALERIDGLSTSTSFASEIFDAGALFPALALPAFQFNSTTSFG